MKQFSYFLGLILLFTTNICFSMEPTLVQAQKLYDKANYLEAAAIYKQLLTNQHNKADLYYNLGNTYFRMEKKGLAKAYFLKSLKLNPRDPDAKYNIAVINQHTVDKIESAQNLSALLLKGINILSLQEYQWLLLFILTFFNLAFLTHIFIVKNTFTKHLSIVLAIFLITSGIIYSIKHYSYFSMKKAVVITKKEPAKGGPLDNQPNLFFVHEGLDCQVLKSAASWVEIRLNNGFTGWIKALAILYI